MFEELFRRIKGLEEGIEFGVPTEADERGYLDKQCPAEQCLFMFKVNEEDWMAVEDDIEVTCPRCGHSAGTDSWWTLDQIEHAKEEAVNWLTGQIHEGLQHSARDINRRYGGHGQFLRMTATVTSPRPRRGVLPAAALDAIEREMTCEHCSSRFCVIGSAFFCPYCGFQDVEHDFESNIQFILNVLDTLPAVHGTIQENLDRDHADDFRRKVLETNFCDCVSVHQIHCTHHYRRIVPTETPGKNVFQRLREGSDMFSEASGEGYEDWLSAEQMRLLAIYFQRRHLIVHRGGIVDEPYLSKTGDPSYELGQRLVITSGQIRDFVSIVRTIGQRVGALQPTGQNM